MRSATLAALLLIPSSYPALALCAGQSPDQKVIFEDRFADNAAEWFPEDRDQTNLTIGDGVMTIDAFASWVIPKRVLADSVPRAVDTCVRFSWPPVSATLGDVSDIGIMIHAVFRSDGVLRFADVAAVDKTGALKRYSLPHDDYYGHYYSPIILGQFPETATGEVVELRVVTTLRSSDGDLQPTEASERFFVNGKEIAQFSGRSSGVVGRVDGKQGYGVYVASLAFLNNQTEAKGSFPIRYFNVLSPN